MTIYLFTFYFKTFQVNAIVLSIKVMILHSVRAQGARPAKPSLYETQNQR